MPARAAAALRLRKPEGAASTARPRYRMDPVAGAEERTGELRALMTRQAGILRTTEGLRDARRRLLDMLAECGRELSAEVPAWAWAALRSRVQVALSIVDSALRQQVNAGTHWCGDLAVVRQGRSARAGSR